MKKFSAGLILVVTVSTLVFWQANHREIVQIENPEISGRWTQEEGTFVLINGDFYQDHGAGRYSFIQNYYDPKFFEKYYQFDGDTILMGGPGDPNLKIKVGTEYSDDFESYETVQDLLITKKNVTGKETVVDGVKIFDPQTLPTRWTMMTLQSPSAPTVKEYVKLRTGILEEGQDFVDNCIEPSGTKFHSGSRSVRFYSVAKSRSMVCCKSSISSETFHFVKGDEFCFSGWFFIEKGMPTTIMDLESSWLDKHSGIRILFSEAGCPSIELKAFEKPMWRNRDFQVPKNRWFFVETKILLDEKKGELKLWIDGELVIEGSGQTLPLADTVLNSLEVGISACQGETELFVDDLVVGKSQR